MGIYMPILIVLLDDYSQRTLIVWISSLFSGAEEALATRNALGHWNLRVCYSGNAQGEIDGSPKRSATDFDVIWAGFSDNKPIALCL